MALIKQHAAGIQSTKMLPRLSFLSKAQRERSRSPRTTSTTQELSVSSPSGRSGHSPCTNTQSISPSLSEVSVSTVSAAAAAKKEKSRKTMSTAARVNARAVAYIHTLNGDPSLRSCWHDADSDSEAASPAMVGMLEKAHGSIFSSRIRETGRQGARAYIHLTAKASSRIESLALFLH